MSDTNNSAKAPKAGGTSKRFRLLLGASLALNLLFVGAFVGAYAKSGGARSGPPNLRSVADPYVSAFDQRAKRAMRTDMRAQLPDRKQAMAANRADYEAFLQIVRQEPFDAARASEIMETQFERGGQFQRVGRKLSIERISQMSPEERKAYADRLQERLENPKKRKKRKER